MKTTATDQRKDESKGGSSQAAKAPGLVQNLPAFANAANGSTLRLFGFRALSSSLLSFNGRRINALIARLASGFAACSFALIAHK
jgi:hypothetical protein